MVAKSGDRCSARTRSPPCARCCSRWRWWSRPTCQKPRYSSGRTIRDDADVRAAAREILALGPRAVVLKGGHRDGPATDLLCDRDGFVEFTAAREPTTNTHGTGCTFSAAIAAGLAQGRDVREAARVAKAYVTGAIRASVPLGRGHGPVAHAWALRSAEF